MRSLLNLRSLLSLFFYGFKSQLLSALEESFIVLTVVNDATRSLNAERRMTDRRSREKSLPELEFNDLNINL